MSGFIIFFILFSGILISWNTIITLLIARAFSLQKRYRLYALVITTLFSLAFIWGMLWANTVPWSLFSFLYYCGSLWVGAITLTGIWVLWLLALSRILKTKVSHGYFFWISIVFLVSINILGLVFSAYPKITEYSIDIPWEHSWHGKRIVMIADTHYGNIYDSDDARKLVHQLNTLSGSIVIVPWDFFDGPKIDFQSVANEFRSIQAPHGTYFVNGNHEEYRNTSEMLSAITQAGIHILNDATVTIDGIAFAGVTYQATENREWLIQALNSLNLNKDVPVILLKHKPTLHDVIGDYPIDLVVSGHTHYGQMWPFSLITRAIYGKYAYGYVSSWSLQSVTTSGVGTWWPPQRIGTRSEIVVITIR